MGKPTVNSELPWAEIRREWETTEITMAELARKYGMSSRTTLKRRRVAEGWVRDEDVVAARQAMADVISDATAIEGTAEVTTAVGGVGALWKPRGDRPPDHRESASQPRGLPLSALVDERGPNGLDAELLLAQRDYSGALATKSQRDVALAIEVQRTGLLLLRRVQGVLQPPGRIVDGEALDDEEVLGNLQRLIRINPDRETLAGLVTAAGKTIDMGLQMERRAMTADVASKLAPGSSEPAGGTLVKGAMDLIKTMDQATAERMRAWAIEVQRERRQSQITQASE